MTYFAAHHFAGEELIEFYYKSFFYKQMLVVHNSPAFFKDTATTATCEWFDASSIPPI